MQSLEVRWYGHEEGLAHITLWSVPVVWSVWYVHVPFRSVLVCADFIQLSYIIGHKASLSTFLIRHIPFSTIFSYFRTFLNLFLNILTFLCLFYFGRWRNVGPRK